MEAWQGEDLSLDFTKWQLLSKNIQTLDKQALVKSPLQTLSSQDHGAFMGKEINSTSKSPFPVPHFKLMLCWQAATGGDLWDWQHTELGQDKYSDLLTEEPTSLKTKDVSSWTQQHSTKDTVLWQLYQELQWTASILYFFL